MMDCRAFERDVAAWCQDETPPDRHPAMLEHRARCQACRALHRALSQVYTEARLAESARLSPAFWPRLEARLEEADSKRACGWVGWRPESLRLRAVAVGTGLLLGLLVGAGLGASWAEAPASTATPRASRDPLPHLAVLDPVPHGSLAELLLETAAPEGPRP
jgi:anti-sigma factor RsiW